MMIMRSKFQDFKVKVLIMQNTLSVLKYIIHYYSLIKMKVHCWLNHFGLFFFSI